MKLIGIKKILKDNKIIYNKNSICKSVKKNNSFNNCVSKVKSK